MPIGSVIGTSIRRPLQAARLVGAGYGWLTRTSPHETPEMRAWMLANVASQTTPVLVGSAAVVATAGAIIGLTGETWPLLWLAFELTVTVLRLILIVQVSRNATPETTDEIRHAALTALGLLWSAAFGAAAWAGVNSGQAAVMVLAALNVAGMVGVTATRNCATPRYATLAMLLVAMPFAFGANASSVYGMMAVGIITAMLLAGMISMLMQNNKLLVRTYLAERRAQKLAVTDSLSGLRNRKSLQDTMRSLSKTWRSGGRGAVSFLYLDLDGFKAVNDEHGHIAGDLLLAAVARRLSASVRDSDPVYRPGGDEFVVILPGGDETVGETLAGRIIAACTEPFEIGLQTPVKIGVSVGGATSVQGGLAPIEALAAADKGLYAAKRAGKGVYRHHPGRPTPDAAPSPSAVRDGEPTEVLPR